MSSGSDIDKVCFLVYFTLKCALILGEFSSWLISICWESAICQVKDWEKCKICLLYLKNLDSQWGEKIGT